jgi:ABC-type transport system involved in multi-copper enzyme maturation permease subunit
VRAILLIAVNFVREQRWPIFVLLLWVLLLAFLGLIADIQRQREDLLFIFKQVAVYVVVFSVFFGGSAIHNERKSRRILAVLSKAVGRQQYLSGLVLGVTIACTIYCFALGITGSWTLGEAGFSVRQVWFLMLYLIVASMLAGTIALMFSTFLNPFFAAGATAMVLGLPAVAAHVGARWEYVIPVYSLSAAVLKSSFKPAGDALWFPLGLAVMETIVFWVLAARIFSRMDIAVAVE